MGKSGKLFKSLVAGVRVFKSPAKERPGKDHEKDYVKKNGKDKCFGSLGKSSSRNREVMSVAAASPEAIEIKCVQVESEKLKDVLPVPVAEAFTPEPHVESKLPAKNQDGAVNGNGLIQLSPTAPKEQVAICEQEEWAASKIQAAFRCYLAQRAFRALRALVRLQALARGCLVRRQAAASLRCVNALIRVQALARGRRVRNSELGQLVQKHLQQTKQTRKKSADGWVNSLATAQQLHAKAQVKQDAVTKRQRALVFAYSEQLNRRTQKQSSSSGLDSQIEKSLWVWEWLERWTAAAPKGASAAVVVEDCVPVTKNIEKAKFSTKGKPLECGRRERRKWVEQADCISPLPQRDIIYEELEEPSIMVKREEEMKVLPESEIRVGTPKANVHVRKPISPPPTTLSTPPHTPLPEENALNALVAREISLHDVQPSASDTSSDVTLSTSPTCVTEAKVASPSEFKAFPSAAWGNNHASGAEKTDDYITLPCPMASSPLSPSSSIFSPSNGHSVYPDSEISPLVSDSPPKEPQLNSLSAFSFSPQDVCPSSFNLSTTHPSKLELNTLGFSAVMCGSSSPESTQGGLMSGVHQPEATIQTTNGDINVHSAEEPEAVHGINGDKGVHTTETDYDAMKVSNEQEGFAMEEKNDDSYQGDTVSETNGGCDSSVVSVDARSIEVTSKDISSLGSKHELTGCISPSLPSYMATTKSSKAKIRALSSPKQKSDSTKQKQDSPKPKLDSPKTKVDSPTTQKVDSASKRRHSLSALDGSKVSPVTQKPAFHVRASSKGNFVSMKDLSSDNISLPNGESRRHGK